MLVSMSILILAYSFIGYPSTLDAKCIGLPNSVGPMGTFHTQISITSPLRGNIHAQISTTSPRSKKTHANIGTTSPLNGQMQSGYLLLHGIFRSES